MEEFWNLNVFDDTNQIYPEDTETIAKQKCITEEIEEKKEIKHK